MDQTTSDILKAVASGLNDKSVSVEAACKLLNTIARFEERTENVLRNS